MESVRGFYLQQEHEYDKYDGSAVWGESSIVKISLPKVSLKLRWMVGDCYKCLPWGVNVMGCPINVCCVK